jgi:hypothetical protein
MLHTNPVCKRFVASLMTGFAGLLAWCGPVLCVEEARPSPDAAARPNILIWEKKRPDPIFLHAKDISIEHSEAERGKVTGTPVGCACGDGVIDWARVIEILRKCPRDIVMSVECGSIDEAERSIKHLKSLL